MHWAGAPPFPHHESFALIGDSDRADAGGTDARGRDRLATEAHHRSIDLLRVMLDPSGTRIELAYLSIGAAQDAAAPVEHHRRGPGRSLVDCEHRFCHLPYSCALFLRFTLAHRPPVCRVARR